MDTLSGFQYAEIEFGKQGEVVRRDSFDALLASVPQGDAPQVIVLVHGWNNDMDDARRLYSGLAERLREVLDASPPSGIPAGPVMLLGVLWPSKKFADRELIPGGAASVAGGPVADAELIARLDELRDVFDAPDGEQRIDQAKTLVDRLEDSPAARDEFVELMRSLVPEGADADADDFARAFRGAPGRDVLAELEAPVLPVESSDAEIMEGGATAVGTDATGSAAFSLSLGGIKAAAERFVNLTTYYQMKERAGVVGINGLNPRLRELRSRRGDVGLHLVGHSFGGRLVTAAAAGSPGGPAVLQDTLTLLQAAFSHYGFADDYEPGHDGFFRRVVTDRLVRGPILITHSIRDTAVGYAYPLASRLARQVASGLGDANDRYGGMGRNGAQRTPEARQGQLRDVGAAYDFAGASVHNLNADSVILDHSDIRKPQIAYAILSAVSSARP
jgi:pimeloyl-ACP methyl ester carboxylesterase